MINRLSSDQAITYTNSNLYMAAQPSASDTFEPF